MTPRGTSNSGELFTEWKWATPDDSLRHQQDKLKSARRQVKAAKRALKQVKAQQKAAAAVAAERAKNQKIAVEALREIAQNRNVVAQSRIEATDRLFKL